VIKDLVSIQRNFLWGGGSAEKKICWVSWDRVCQPRKKGGLGIKKSGAFQFFSFIQMEVAMLN
jgi:hypothetical protein